MASRFWVGGTGNWDAATTTHWSATSGGAGGASVPTSADDVILDASSGGGTVTVTISTATCQSINTTGFTGSIANISGTLTVRGNITLGASMASGFVCPINHSTNPGTVTSNGKTINTFSVVNGASTTLADAMNVTQAITLTQGTFNSAGFAVTASSFAGGNSNTRTLTLGSSTVTLTGSFGFVISPATNLTITANTATIVATSGNITFASGANLNGASIVLSGPGTYTISSGTVASFTRTGTASTGDALTLNGDLICTGTFAVNGNSASNRLLVQTNAVGTPHTITAAAVSASNVDFMDIVAAGAASWDLSAITGGSGDAGGNSGITFTASATQTRSGVGGNWSTAANWTSRVPLPQDDVIVNAGASGTITPDMPRWGRSVDFTGFTGTLGVAAAGTLYGSLTFASGMTITASRVVAFGGRSAYTLTSNGKTYPNGLNVTAPNGTLTLADAAAFTGTFSLNAGTFDANGYDITMAAFSSTGATTRSLRMGNGTWLLLATSLSAWGLTDSGMTLDAGNSNIVISTTSVATRVCSMGTATYATVTYVVAGSTGALLIGGGPTIGNLVIGSGRTLTFAAGATTTVGAWNVSGAAGSLTTINSATAGTITTIKPTVGATLPFQADYLSLKDIRAQTSSGSSGTGLWYAGTHSTDAGNNTGWLFTAAPFIGWGNPL